MARKSMCVCGGTCARCLKTARQKELRIEAERIARAAGLRVVSGESIKLVLLRVDRKNEESRKKNEVPIGERFHAWP